MGKAAVSPYPCRAAATARLNSNHTRLCCGVHELVQPHGRLTAGLYPSISRPTAPRTYPPQSGP